MENRELRSFDDIENYLHFIETEYNKSYDDLNSIVIGTFEIKGKKSKEEQKRDLRGQLLTYVRTYEHYDRFLKDATTFRRQDFIRFLADYFTIVYGRKYVVKSGIKDGKQLQSVITYDLVISEDDLDRFSSDSKVLESLDFKSLFDSCHDCCLLLNDSLKFTLLDGKNLSEDFEDFPELMAAGRRLVDLKLSNPEMSDQKRLMSILSNTCLDLKGSYDVSSDEGYGQKLEKVYPESQI